MEHYRSAYYDLQNYQQVIDDLTQAIKLNPNNVEAYFNRGAAHLNLQNYQHAISDWTQTINLNPNHSDAYVCRGLCYKELGDSDLAEMDFEKARQLGWEK